MPSKNLKQVFNTISYLANVTVAADTRSLKCNLLRNQISGCEMAQQVKKPSTKPEDLSSFPGTHMVEGGNQFLKFVSLFSDLYMCTVMCVQM